MRLRLTEDIGDVLCGTVASVTELASASVFVEHLGRSPCKIPTLALLISIRTRNNLHLPAPSRRPPPAPQSVQR